MSETECDRCLQSGELYLDSEFRRLQTNQIASSICRTLQAVANDVVDSNQLVKLRPTRTGFMLRARCAVDFFDEEGLSFIGYRAFVGLAG